MATEFDARIKFKRDTSSNWTSNNPILLNGEIILVDTDSGELRAKVGDGVKSYTQLPFSDEVIRNLVTEHNISETAHENMGWITSDDGLPSEPALINADTLGGIAADEYATKEYIDNNGKNFLIQIGIKGQTDDFLEPINANINNRITTKIYVDKNNYVWIDNIEFVLSYNSQIMSVCIYFPEEYRNKFSGSGWGMCCIKSYWTSSGSIEAYDTMGYNGLDENNDFVFASQNYDSARKFTILNGCIGTLNE